MIRSRSPTSLTSVHTLTERPVARYSERTSTFAGSAEAGRPQLSRGEVGDEKCSEAGSVGLGSVPAQSRDEAARLASATAALAIWSAPSLLAPSSSTGRIAARGRYDSRTTYGALSS